MNTGQYNNLCRIGLIGAGRIGKLHANHIKYYLPQFCLTSIADPNIDRQWAQQLNISCISSRIEDVLFQEDLDAILIASPSDQHLDQIIAASESGKAIFCEKPIGLVEEDIVSALDKVRQNNTLLQLGFNRRFDPSFAQLQKRVQSGEVGSPHLIKITSRDPSCPSKEYCAGSGGIFMDMSIHDFDMARFLIRSEVVEVHAMGSVLINSDLKELNDVDTAVIQLRFANGALGVIDNSRQAVYGYDQRIEVFGSEGMLLATNQIEHAVQHYTKTSTSLANPHYFFLERYQQAYIAELHSFYEAWANNKPCLVTGDDGLMALRIAKAAQRSLDTRLPATLD